MGQIKKRRKALLEALQGLFAGDAHKQQLKKVRAFEAFIEKLEDRRAAVREALERGEDLGHDQKRTLERQLEILDAQIPKAEKLLQDMEQKQKRKG